MPSLPILFETYNGEKKSCCQIKKEITRKTGRKKIIRQNEKKISNDLLIIF
tara:strand:+ start:41 stop:193 length:153 start_codon:yes stop_codon:yes gene_type:complete